MCEALEVAVADPSITVVDLHGHGPAFCSGATSPSSAPHGIPPRHTGCAYTAARRLCSSGAGPR
ncbi:hypothetical protein SAZ11_60300 [Streptomyces sp. FXJ1.4098]|nr:hypothetical protein [Streptomyces sp. FXJ1.4098]